MSIFDIVLSGRKQKKSLRYSDYYDLLIALVTFLGSHGDTDRDAVCAPDIALYLGLKEADVRTVLDGFKSIFRRSSDKYGTRQHGEQFLYTLHLRYARRKYDETGFVEYGRALNGDELFSLINFIATRAHEEEEGKRQRTTMLLTAISSVTALIAAIVSIFLSLR